MIRDILVAVVVLGCIMGMIFSGYMFCTLTSNLSNEIGNETILECQINTTIASITVNTPTSFWGQECMDCHRNPHDPMNGVPSEKEFNGHKNLDCLLCHAGYTNEQKCISCHEGHDIFSTTGQP
jgi:hypothetical protein